MSPNYQPEFVDFYLPFGGRLFADNRWVKRAALAPWELVADCYAQAMSDSGLGAPPRTARVAFGALLIKELLGITDEETVEQIFENPYLQCFLGYRERMRETPFDPSMMVYFRSRFTQSDYDEINAQIIAGEAAAQAAAPAPALGPSALAGQNPAAPKESPSQAAAPAPALGPSAPAGQNPAAPKESPSQAAAPAPALEPSAPAGQNPAAPKESPSPAPAPALEGSALAGEDPAAQDRAANPPSPPTAPKGKLLIDATVAPADITYPTDLKRINETREKLEHLIDLLHPQLPEPQAKPGAYRRKARKAFLAIAKLNRPGAKKIRKGIGHPLRYVRRDLDHIDTLLQAGAPLGALKAYDYRCLLVAHEIYRQQEEMWREKKHRIDDRIVSLSQPWVRPIVRGKAAAQTEFGAKISVSVSQGYVSLHRLSWDAYNEGGDLIAQVESYRQRHGHYPESVHADTIYRTRANRAWCRQRGIRLSGPPLGRPRQPREDNAQELAAAKAQARQDELDRIPVEGKFGNLKRGGTLARVMAKLAHTSVSVINVGLIVLNLNTRLRKQRFLALWTGLLRACGLDPRVPHPIARAI